MKSAVLCLLLGGKYASAGSSGDWDYDHQDEWEDTYSMCNNNDQSPIDIDTSNVINDDTICTKDFDWDLNYAHSTFRVENNGYALKLVECIYIYIFLIYIYIFYFPLSTT